MSLNKPPGVSGDAEADFISTQADLLGEEISFWQEMLSSLEGSDQPRESVERVQQALALATYRLALIMRHSSQ
jgi:hypothetical protein